MLFFGEQHALSVVSLEPVRLVAVAGVDMAAISCLQRLIVKLTVE
jgi:hypothetical protein